MRLAGKIALITGASHGIGRATALRFAEEGADVAITFRERADGARETARAIEALGRRCHVVQVELSDPAAAARLVDEVSGALGPLDILVNNAGGGRSDALRHAELAGWNYTLALGVTAPMLLAQAAARGMIARGSGGAIVSISSVHALRAWPNDGAYGVAKLALVRLTESLALEWAHHGIRVNCVAPGYIEVAATPEERARYAREKAHAEPIIPLRRTGRPEELAAVVLFLCSDEASYMTGQTLVVDGGLLLAPVTTGDYLRADREVRGFSG